MIIVIISDEDMLEIYKQAHEQTAISTALHFSKLWEQFADSVYSILKYRHLENFFHRRKKVMEN